MQTRKTIWLPKAIVKQIEVMAKAEASTLSQFMRTAAINELKRKHAA